MKRNGTIWLTNLLYGAGALVSAALSVIWLIRAERVLWPDAMLPMALYEMAAFWLAAGAIPLGAAAWAVYSQNELENCAHPRCAAALLALPVVPCCMSALGITAVFMVSLFSIKLF